MPYLGNTLADRFTTVSYQDLTGGSGTSFTLDHPAGSAQDIEVFVNNVRQEPGVAYTVAGTTMTMTGTVASTDDFYVVFQGKALQTVTPGTNTITTAMIQDNAISAAKIASGAGGMDWSASPKTASFTAEAGKGYFIDTSSSAITMTLPASPSIGDRVALIDYKSNANNNNITIEDNGSNFKGNAIDFVTLSTAGVSVMLIYSDAGQGWVVAYSDTDTDSAITYPSYTVDALIVAGGGGGSSGTGSGGGGAGGFLEGTLTFRANTVYTVTVGAGGSGSTRNPNANAYRI